MHRLISILIGALFAAALSVVIAPAPSAQACRPVHGSAAGAAFCLDLYENRPLKPSKCAKPHKKKSGKCLAPKRRAR